MLFAIATEVSGCHTLGCLSRDEQVVTQFKAGADTGAKCSKVGASNNWSSAMLEGIIP
jgi:hypothetical protein